MWRLSIGLLVLAVTGCGSGSSGAVGRGGPQRVGVQGARAGSSVAEIRHDEQHQSQTLAMSFDAAWTRLPELLQELGLSVGAMDEAAGRIAHTGERVRRIDGKRLSRYLDCGMGATAEAYANLYEVTFGYEIIIRRNPDGQTLSAEMRIDASAKPREVSGNALFCTSQGRLEKLIFQRLQTGN